MEKRVSLFILIIFVTVQIFSVTAFAVDPQIVIDGNTATELNKNDNITEVRTKTVNGDNALNSFLKFNVNKDNIVNLHFPAGTENLINLVHQEKSFIDGTLNSIKNKQIGGNVYFLNPHGIMVGADGVVNVGSLTAVTPTSQYMDSFFTNEGHLNSTALKNLSDGQIPITESGLITVKGRINAVNDIKIEAGTVKISASNEAAGIVNTGAEYEKSSNSNQDKLHFRDVVNTSGVKRGSEIRINKGSIKIKAAQDFINEGTVAATGNKVEENNEQEPVENREIDIKAGRDIKLKEGSLISARGGEKNPAGGDIVVFADNKAEFNEGATIDASGINEGKGGFIELSAKKQVQMAGGEFKAAAENGINGRVLIDPEEIEIIANDKIRGNLGADHYFNGADFDLEATKRITVEEDVIVSTRKLDYTSNDHLEGSSAGDSGNIFMKAPIINLKNGAKLYAHADNSYQAGDIQLTAQITKRPDIIKADADTGINIDGATLQGNNITMEAKATADYTWSVTDNHNIVQEAVSALGQSMSNVKVAVVQSDANSVININDGTNLQAAGSINLTAYSDSQAKLISSNLSSNKKASIGFVYGNVVSNAEVNIADNTSIEASNLNLSAFNNANLDTRLYSITKAGEKAQIGVALTNADVNAITDIASGANLNISDNVSVAAVNNSNFITKVSTINIDTGKAGIAAAISNVNTEARASIGSELNTGNITIEAFDNINENTTTANAALGSNVVVRKIMGTAAGSTDFIKSKLGMQPKLNSSSGSTSKPNLAGAVAISDTDHSATAYIKDNTQIEVDNNLAVVSKVKDLRPQNQAVSSIKVNADGDANNPDAKYAMSAAVSYGDYDHNSKAYIGENSQITAKNLGLSSEVLIPYQITWHKWEGLSTITNKLNSNLGLADGFLNGFANATGNPENGALNGAVNYIDFNNNSNAFIKRNTTISMLPGGENNWASQLPSQNLFAELASSPNSVINFNKPLSISANSEFTGVFAAGNLALNLSNAQGEATDKAAGGAYNQINYSSDSKAYITEGVVVETIDTTPDDEESPDPVDISITADSKEKIIAIGPSAGDKASYGLKGVFNLSNIDSHTEASIDDEAQIEVSDLDIKATEEVISWSITGAYNRTESMGFGFSTAINDIKTNTYAFVGDNDQYNEDNSQLTLDKKELKADNVEITARHDGRIEAIAVSLQNTGGNNRSNNLTDSPQGSAVADSTQNAQEGVVDSFSKANSTTVSDTNNASQPSFGLGISGSAAVNLTDLTTKAYIKDTDFNLESGSQDNSLILKAVTDSDITAGAGAGALLRAGKDSSGFKAAIAGSVAVNKLNNSNETYLDDSKIINSDNIILNSLSGGELLSLALGLSLNTSQSNSASIAGSVSISETANKTKAYLKDSIVEGKNSESGDEHLFDLYAYDRTKIGTGGGSLVAGGKGGFGAAVSYTEIANDINTYLNNSSVQGFDNINIYSLSANRIAAGAGMVGGSTNSFGGSLVITNIGNEITAEIKKDSLVIASQVVNLKAEDTKPLTELDNIIDSKDEGHANQSSLDYQGTEINTKQLDKSSILSVAGVVQGGSNNIGISFSWNQINNNYKAVISDSSVQSLNSSETDSNINVSAHSQTAITSYSLGAGIAGQFAGGGSISINEINNSVLAEINDELEAGENRLKEINTDQLTITAQDDSKIKSLAGQVTLAGGSTSIGVAYAHNKIGEANNLNETKASLNNIGLAVQNINLNSQQGGFIKSWSVSGAGAKDVAISGSLVRNDIKNKTTISIIDIKSINSNNNITALAEDNKGIETLSGAVTAAGSVAVGGTAAINNVDGITEAYFTGGTINNETELSGLALTARADKSIISRAYQGSGSLSLAVGAAITKNKVNQDITSSIKEGSNLFIKDRGNLSLKATDNINLISESQGYQFSGAVAAGAVISKSLRAGNTKTMIGDDTTNDVSTNIKMEYGDLKIESRYTGSVKAKTIAGAGGIIATLNASYAQAKVGEKDNKVNVLAKIADRVQIGPASEQAYFSFYPDNIYIKAIARPHVKTESNGYNGAVKASAGLSRADSDLYMNITSSIDENSSITAYDLDIDTYNLLNNDKNTAYSYARNLNASGLLGVNAAKSTSDSDIDVKTVLSSDLNIFRGTYVNTQNTNSQYAEVLGVNAAGVGGLGAYKASATSDSRTDTLIKAVELKSGYLDFKSIGSDTNKSYAKSGTGAIISGAAAKATTDTYSDLNLKIAKGALIDVRLGNSNLQATHNTYFNSQANSINASLVGKSGAYTTNTVLSSVNLDIEDDVQIINRGANILSENNITQNGKDSNVKAGSGGVLDDSAVKSINIIFADTDLDIGKNVRIKSKGNPLFSPGNINMGANNKLNLFDETVLKAGGAISRAHVQTTHIADLSAEINLDKNVNIISSGDLNIRTYIDSSITSSALVKTYGGIGDAGGMAYNKIDTEQIIKIGRKGVPTSEGIILESAGDMELAAGKSADGIWENNIDSETRTEIYNYTGIPVDTDPKAYSVVDSINRLEMEDNTTLNSGGDINLGIFKGDVDLVAEGRGHNPYLELFGTVKTTGETVKNISNNIYLYGDATAGIYNTQRMTIDSQGDVTEATSRFDYFKSVTNPSEDLQDEIDYLRTLKEQAETADRKADLEGEITVLEMLKEVERDRNIDYFYIQDLYASGGNINIEADNFKGAGTMIAKGGPTIKVDNYSNYYLKFESISIPPENDGGNININGGISSGFSLDSNPGGATWIRINNYYDSGASNHGPGIYLTGPIENLSGEVNIYNRSGNLAQFSTLEAKEIEIKVPNGFYIVNNPSGIFHTSAAPEAVWGNAGFNNLSIDNILGLAAEYHYKNGDYYGDINQFLKDPEGEMGQDNVDGTTFVLKNIPNVYDSDRETSSQVKLFNGFWMDKVSNLDVIRTADYNAGAHSDQAKPDLLASQIGINARAININGKIRAGNPSDWSIKINPVLKDWLTEQSGSKIIDIPQQFTQEVDGSTVTKTNYSKIDSDDNIPILQYDQQKDRLILNDINASGGGFVYLRGKIISTNRQGEIELLNGLGDVKIDNNSDIPLEIGGINTGSSTLGKLKIEDTAKNKTTWYINDLQGGTRVFTDHINTNGDYRSAREITNHIDVNTYQPKENLRYQWQHQFYLSRHFDGDAKSGDESLFYRFNQPSSWQKEIYNRNYSKVIEDRYIDDYFYSQVTRGNIPNDYYSIIVNDMPTDEGWPKDGTWYFKVFRAVELGITSSIKADNSIDISFKGNANANLDITSNSDIFFTDKISNIKGLTDINVSGSGKSIKQTYNAVINSNDIKMFADNMIGTKRQSIKLVPDYNNNLRLESITNHGDINIEVPRNSLIINELSAGNNTYGFADINLTVKGDITNQESPIEGSNISLISEQGSIGNISHPLLINSHSQAFSNGEIGGGEVKLEAENEINIIETVGDLRLLKAQSHNDSVIIKINNGNLVNIVEERRIDQDRRNALANIWNKLDIKGEQVQKDTVTPFVNSVNRTYNQYWRLAENGQIQNGEFVLNENLDYYRIRAKALLGEKEVTDLQVKEYAAEVFKEYQNYFTDVFSTDWKSLAQFQQYDSNYTYQIDAAKREAITKGVKWLESELLYQISQNALKDPEESGQLVKQDPNIISNGEYLVLESVNKGIGNVGEPVSIDLPQAGESINLTTTQAAALTRASMPGDVYLLNSNGEKISLADRKEAASIKVRQTNPIYVSTDQKLSVLAKDEIFVNSSTDLKLHEIKAGGDIRLVTDGNILDRATAQAITGQRNLLLDTGGNIGEVGQPLRYSIEGMLASVTSAENIYLRNTVGNMRLVRMGAVKDIKLEVPTGGIYGQEAGLSLSARNLNLAVAGSIKGKGYDNVNDYSLYLKVKPEGELTGNIGGEVTISTPGYDLNIGQVKTEGDFNLKASQNTFIKQIDATGFDINLKASDSIKARSLASLDNLKAVNIDLQANIGSIGEVDNFLLTDSSNPTLGSISVLAGNDIYLRESQGSLNIDKFSAGRNIGLMVESSILANNNDQKPTFVSKKLSLESGNGSIGKEDNYITIQVEELTKAVARKGIYLKEIGDDLTAAFIESRNDSVFLTVPDGNMYLGEVRAKNELNLTGTGNLTADYLKANTILIAFKSPNSITNINNMEVDGEFKYFADNIKIDKLLHQGKEPLLLSLEGGSKILADDIVLNGSSEAGFVFEKLYADYAEINLESDYVNYRKTKIGSRSIFNTNSSSVLVDNINKKLYAYDLQLYPQNDVFSLLFREDQTIKTDSMVVNYHPDFIINEFSTENSIIRMNKKLRQVLGNLNKNFIQPTLINHTLLLDRSLMVKLNYELINLNTNSTSIDIDNE